MSVGVPADAVVAELGAMQQWVVGKPASRSVLGSINDLAYQLQFEKADFADRSLLEHSLSLARTPLKLIEYEGPDRATVAAFAAHRVLLAASSRDH